jgi:hypothetical protein
MKRSPRGFIKGYRPTIAGRYSKRVWYGPTYPTVQEAEQFCFAVIVDHYDCHAHLATEDQPVFYMADARIEPFAGMVDC